MNKASERIGMGIILLLILFSACRIPEQRCEEVQIILHRQWWRPFIVIDNRSPFFSELLKECENLFGTAKDRYKLSPQKDLPDKVRKNDVVLEIIYPEVTLIIRHNGEKSYLTRLLIPLSAKKWYDGTIFYHEAYERSLREKSDYPSISDRLGVIINHQGTGKLKDILRKMGTDVSEICEDVRKY